MVGSMMKRSWNVQDIVWLALPTMCGGSLRPAECRCYTRDEESEPVEWVSPEATVLTWESRLTCPMSKESIVLSGSHYHGLGMRFVRSMDASGEFRNPDNKPGIVFRGEERLVRSRWCAYTAQADGKTVTVAMFDHPENVRHPATWFMMAKPFAYLSATLRLHEEPLKLLRGESLTLRYGVALWDGRPENEQIEALYQEWVKAEGPHGPATYNQ